MTDRVIRPSMKQVRIWYCGALSVILLAVVVHVLSKTTRTIQPSKIQDVRVDQSLGQHLLGVGDIAIETSGETNRLEMDNLDHPQSIADDIIAASQEHGNVQGHGNP